MHPLPSPAAWNLDPLTLAGLVALLAGFWVVTGPLTRRYVPDQRLSRGRVLAFLSGWVLLALVVVTPVDTLGRYYLFSAHAFQVFVIATCVAPLLLAGVPEWVAWTLLRTRGMRDATRGFAFTLLATFLFNALILIWHVGPLYEAAARNAGAHNLSLLFFLVAGCIGWWPVMTPLDRHTRLASPAQIIYVALNSLPLDIFGIFILFAGHLLYPLYASAPIVFGLSHTVDQAIGGGILAVPNTIIDVVIMSLAFFGWMQRSERAQIEREIAEYADEMPAPLDATVLNSTDAQG
jgi:putative membrane protein